MIAPVLRPVPDPPSVPWCDLPCLFAPQSPAIRLRLKRHSRFAGGAVRISVRRGRQRLRLDSRSLPTPSGPKAKPRNGLTDTLCSGLRMRVSRITPGLLTGLALLTTGCKTTPPGNGMEASTERLAVQFLKREVPAWHRENSCYSCHNNGDGARALMLTQHHGFDIPRAVLKGTLDWVSHPAVWASNHGNPGFTDQRLANLQFATALLAAIDAGLIENREALRAAARLIALDQAADGSWPVEPQNPAGSPATYGTALATMLGQRVMIAADIPAQSERIRLARSWLDQRVIQCTPDAAALTLASGGSLSSRHAGYEFLRKTQNPDGGWGPYPQSPSEVFDTALALLALATLDPSQEVQRALGSGRGFLIQSQNSDGSWPATTRPTSNRSYAQQISTTSWAVMALSETRRLTR